jgi:hypothetical protein
MTDFLNGIKYSAGKKMITVLCLALLLFSQMGAAPAPLDGTVLLRLDLDSEAQLAPLAEMGLPILAQVGASQDGKDLGSLLVAALADASQRQELARLGYPLAVLDPEPQGASYYLLYGSADELSRAGQVAQPLLVEGRQALLRLTAGQVESLDALGLYPMLLEPHAILPPADQALNLLPAAITPRPSIQGMIDQLTSDTLSTYVGNLSGEQSVTIGGDPYTILTRYTLTDQPIQKATRYVYEHFQGLGLQIGYDYYILPGYGVEKRNVLAQQVGDEQPGRIFLLTAHLDSRSQDPYTFAPGADDNASGSAAVLAIADILSQYHFNCTLRYALFTGEEQGLYGSIAYANDIVASGEDLQGVLNLDMLGYNTPGSASTIELHTRPNNGGDQAIANLFADAVSAYNISLTPQILPDRLSFSDHAPFWDRGYPAILAIEDWDDHTPDYHRTTDRLGTLNMTYYTRFAKAALATFAHMGCLIGDVGGTVTDAVSGSPLQGVEVAAFLGSAPDDTRQTLADGTYQHLLEEGSYSLVFSAPDYRTLTLNNVQVVAGEHTSRDAALQPCETVKGASFSLSSNRYPVGQPVAFSAVVDGGEAPLNITWDFGDGASGSGQEVTHSYSAPGAYPVSLTVDNSCLSPAADQGVVLVGEDFLFLPVLAR